MNITPHSIARRARTLFAVLLLGAGLAACGYVHTVTGPGPYGLGHYEMGR